jgi:hypothetical protein
MQQEGGPVSSTSLRYRGPEEITFEENEAEPKRWEALLNTHWKQNHKWIKEEAEKRGFVWVVVCGKDIVYGGSDLRDFPPDEETKEALGRACHRVPFAYQIK